MAPAGVQVTLTQYRRPCTRVRGGDEGGGPQTGRWTGQRGSPVRRRCPPPSLCLQADLEQPPPQPSACRPAPSAAARRGTAFKPPARTRAARRTLPSTYLSLLRISSSVALAGLAAVRSGAATAETLIALAGGGARRGRGLSEGVPQRARAGRVAGRRRGRRGRRRASRRPQEASIRRSTPPARPGSPWTAEGSPRSAARVLGLPESQDRVQARWHASHGVTPIPTSLIRAARGPGGSPGAAHGQQRPRGTGAPALRGTHTVALQPHAAEAPIGSLGGDLGRSVRRGCLLCVPGCDGGMNVRRGAARG
jgi:hypothetical protein